MPNLKIHLYFNIKDMIELSVNDYLKLTHWMTWQSSLFRMYLHTYSHIYPHKYIIKPIRGQRINWNSYSLNMYFRKYIQSSFASKQAQKMLIYIDYTLLDLVFTRASYPSVVKYVKRKDIMYTVYIAETLVQRCR